ncbi:S-adenosyl-L-methionine-dependent methyltransferase [Cokeromyces recurvatus]|uniref:S-adenosyl-L-methionine-dependent methyltransferase n=1 Tax=Cokeromyces recurvatus TaxID=90255 RepID=UPI002220859B|nr:S-adenosyl-L-methionine-dependent methyltransferase [Cokeromyces recurvatus]KAI7898372.1 S-adenosyl-L-methionine-dependent methyltransferase [Cokeromyces recurvatus]
MSSDTETTTPQVEKKKGGHQRGNKKSVENKKKPISKKKEKQLQRETERRNAVMAAFNKHYEEEWGSQRWPQLLEAMKKPVRHCIMINKYANVDDVKTKLKDVLSDLTMLDFIPSVPCYASKSQSRFPPPSKDSNNIMDYYILDAGSVLATEALDIQPDDQVLDICAAPGGKTLAILQRLDRKYGRLTSNEIASDRRRRLRQVIETYLPLDVMEEMSTVVGKDGTRYYGEPEQYDKVLLDAPCSSERHLLHDEKELELWTPKRTQVNAKRQLAILKAALHSVRVNGLVLYGTCSISSLENDKVIERMMRKGKIPIEPIKMKWPIGERTKYGWIILPDKTEGWGPLYFSLLRRTGVSKDGESSEEDIFNIRCWKLLLPSSGCI